MSLVKRRVIMKDFLTKNFGWIVAIGLFLLWQQGCFGNKKEDPTIVVVRDTAYVEHAGTSNSRPVVVNVIPNTNVPQEYVPSANYEVLKGQYEDLRGKFLQKNIQKDKLTIDTLGWVETTDTVEQNTITGRKWDYSIKEKVITNTITITNPVTLRNQVYLGVEAEATAPNLIDRVSGGVFLKNKKDHVFGATVGYDFPSSTPVFGVKYYRKLSFKRALPIKLP